MTQTIMWFRRDLRRNHNDALARATQTGHVTYLYVLDPALLATAGVGRSQWLASSLQSLNTSLGGRLVIASGDPVHVVPQIALDRCASDVFVTRDFGRYGTRRDKQVAGQLRKADISFHAVGSNYAVPPGSLHTNAGTSFRVFGPYYKQWLATLDTHNSCDHAITESSDESIGPYTQSALALLGHGDDVELDMPPAGEAAAWAAWRHFLVHGLQRYNDDRDRPDHAGTSNISSHLRWGEVHPTALARELVALPESPGRDAFLRELAWREFFADVWHANPETFNQSLDRRFDTDFQWDTGEASDNAFAAWQHGRTGFPIVDAGMRQLRATGWMHNRVRMVVASFLVKDLHIHWRRGAAEFMYWLRDGDPASNQQNWQWVAGCGTDAAPFFRIFNPTTQGQRFDPNGDYVRQWVGELRQIPGRAVHEPWRLDPADHGGLHAAYPRPIVDHAAERADSLRRFADLPARSQQK